MQFLLCGYSLAHLINLTSLVTACIYIWDEKKEALCADVSRDADKYIKSQHAIIACIDLPIEFITTLSLRYRMFRYSPACILSAEQQD